MATVRYIDKDVLNGLQYLGRGGQGVVYRVSNVTLSDVGAGVFKEYLPEALASLNVSALRRAVNFFGDLSRGDAVALLGFVAWPVKLVVSGGNVIGFIMPEVPKRFRVSLKRPSGGRQPVLAEFSHLLNPPAWRGWQKIDPPIEVLIALLVDVARCIAFLHRYRIVVGDISPNNLLYGLTPTPKCYIIDCDSMLLAGTSALPQGETPNWSVGARSGEPPATKASDSFKLSLLALRLLVHDHHSRDPSSLPMATPARLRLLIEAGLSIDPEARPSAQDWVDTLLPEWRRLPPPQRGNSTKRESFPPS